MKKQTFITAFLAGAVAAQAAPAAELVIAASGFDHADGQAIARIYAQGDNPMNEPRWTAHAVIHDGHATLRTELPPASYAVTVFHDENGNGRLDHNMFGLPGEPLGFSGGFSLSLTSGFPTFEKLRFELPPAGATVRIEVR
jgi:uncharacterized protein (DUF2141 family)